MTYLLFLTVIYAVTVAWATRVWAVTIPQIVLFSAVFCVCVQRFRSESTIRFPLFLAAPGAMAAIGSAQLLFNSTAYAFPTANGTLDWAGYLACAWLAAQLRPREMCERVLVWLAYFAGAVGACSILTAFTSPFQIFWLVPARFEQVFGPYVYRNHLAGFVELSLPVVIFLAVRQTERRPLFVTIAAVLVSAVVVAASRTGLILVGLELFAMLALAAYKQWLTPKASLMFSLLLISSVLAGAAVTGFSFIQTRFSEEHPYQVRYEVLQSTLDMARARPVAGWGLGNFRTVYPAYSRIDPGVLVNEAHNDWAQWASEGGLGAPLVMLIFALWVLRAGFRTGWALGPAAIFCHALLDYPFEEPSLVLLVMLLSGLAWNSEVHGGGSQLHRSSARRRNRPTVPGSSPAWADPVGPATLAK